jgi:hypothetical protein
VSCLSAVQTQGCFPVNWPLLLSVRYVEFHIFPYNYMEYIQVADTVGGRSSYLYLIYNVEGYRNYIICLILNLRSNMLLLSKIPFIA